MALYLKIAHKKFQMHLVYHQVLIIIVRTVVIKDAHLLAVDEDDVQIIFGGLERTLI